MKLKIDAKFEKRLTCGLKNDMRNLANFYQSTWKSQNWGLDGILLSKAENAWAQNLQRTYDNKEWCKIWKGIYFLFQKRNFANFHRPKNSDFTLGSKMAELNQTNNLKQLDRPDVGRKLILP